MQTVPHETKPVESEPDGLTSIAFDPTDVTHGVGKMLRALRRARGLSMRQVADKAKVSVSHVCGLENGNTGLTVDMLWRLCRALGVRPHVALRGKDSHRPLLEVQLKSVGPVSIDASPDQANPIRLS